MATMYAEAPPCAHDQDMGRDLGDPAYRHQCRTAFLGAAPFPHIVIDHLFALPLLRAVADEFDTGLAGARTIANPHELTVRSTDPAHFGPATLRYFDMMHRHAMVGFLSQMADVSPLFVDPALLNGGLHECRDGGHFDIHLDFNRHRQTMLDNALVAITYLNEDWQADWGGELELWCSRERRIVRSIAPVMGRTVIFAHGPNSFHGHTAPVNTGGRATRRSVATYYYTRRVAARDKLGYRSTVFALDEQNRFAPSDIVSAGPGRTPRQVLGEAARLAVPPFLWNLGRHIAGLL
jgi:hypothetical protein